MPVKTVRKFVFSCKGEQQLSASLRFANQIAGVLKLFSLAVGVGAPAASFLYIKGHGRLVHASGDETSPPLKE